MVCILSDILPFGYQRISIKKKIQLAITSSKLTIEALERDVKYWRRSVVFIVNFERIPHLVLVFLLLTLSS